MMLASCGGSSDGIKPSSTSISGDAGDYFTIVDKTYPAFTKDKNSIYVELMRNDGEFPDAGRGYMWLTVEFLDKDGNIIEEDKHQSDNIISLKPGETTSIQVYGPLNNDERSKVVSFKAKGYMEYYDMNETKSSVEESTNKSADITGMSLKGNIDKYPISLWLEINDGFATGWYRYTKTGSGTAMDLDGTYSNGKLELREMSDGKVTGSWNITVDSIDELTSQMEASGTMTNKANGKVYDVTLSGVALSEESGKTAPQRNSATETEDVYDSGSSSSSSSNDIDELLDKYEKAVNNYMKLMKKMGSGDFSAANQIESVSKEVSDLQDKIAAKENSMTSSQVERFLKISSEGAANAM